MKLKPCEFEEGEYRAPLFNQLHTSNLLWEPGQVFEGHIGIDHALFTTHAYLHALHGYVVPLDGVVLSRYLWGYIWSRRKRKKKLPSFRLNVFIQAKRPQYGRYAPKALRAFGLKSPYWRFEITPHQQTALERLRSNLKNRAIVCYACPAFHKESVLHRWTVEPRIVEHSTFPDVASLTGHIAWNFSEPGARGAPNQPGWVDDAPFFERLQTLIAAHMDAQLSPVEELQFLATAAKSAVLDQPGEPGFMQAQFADGLGTINEIADTFSGVADKPAVVAYGTVLLFTYLNRLAWFVAGNGD